MRVMCLAELTDNTSIKNRLKYKYIVRIEYMSAQKTSPGKDSLKTADNI
jgi:hypothetical protein